MAAARHNRPFVMIYGGSIKRGHSKLLSKSVNIGTCYEAAGAFTYNKLHPTAEAAKNGATPSGQYSISPSDGLPWVNPRPEPLSKFLYIQKSRLTPRLFCRCYGGSGKAFVSGSWCCTSS